MDHAEQPRARSAASPQLRSGLALAESPPVAGQRHRFPGGAAEAAANRRRMIRRAVCYGALVLVTIAVFGPYTAVAGIRTEQIVVYSLMLAGILSGRALRITGLGALLALLLITQLLVAAVGSPSSTRVFTIVRSGSVLAGLDNLLLPIAVLALALMMASSGVDPRRLLRTVCTIVVVAMCVNTVLSCVSLRYDITPLLSMFWENNAAAESVASRAAQMGRLTGIFNQPAEAGALYSLAVLAAIYRYRDSTLAFVLSATLLTVGGVLTVSKIFLMIGLPLGLWQVVRSAGIARSRLWALSAAGLLTMCAAQYGLLPPWAGVDYLTRLLRPPGGGDSDLIGFYTAGRLGDTPTLQYVWDAVLGSSPWFGLGAGGLASAYDNGWVEALAVAGIVGVLLHTGVLGCLVAAWYTRRSAMDPPTAQFASGLVLVLIGASLGLPVLTSNRVATIAWLLIGLLLLAPAPRPEHGAGRSGSRPGGSSRTERVPRGRPEPADGAADPELRRIVRGGAAPDQAGSAGEVDPGNRSSQRK